MAFGTLVIAVGIPPTQFKNESRVFLRSLGNLLRAVVLIKKDSFGADMIYPWYDPNKARRFRRAYVGDTVEVTTQPGRVPDG